MSPFFFRRAKNGCTHAVGFATFRMIKADSRLSSSDFTLGSKGTDTGRDPLIATGRAFSTNSKWHGGPDIWWHDPNRRVELYHTA
jgi:hypothetical protein